MGYFARLLIVVVTVCAVVPAYCAEWRDCEKAKLRELKLQRNADDQKSVKRKKHHRTNTPPKAEEIDTWLWKNCREFSYELRQLEQDNM